MLLRRVGVSSVTDLPGKVRDVWIACSVIGVNTINKENTMDITTSSRFVATAATLLALGIPPGANAATSSQSSRELGRQKVCSSFAYVKKEPAVRPVGTLFKGTSIDVRRYSPSGKYAFGRAYGHVNRNGWVKTDRLCGHGTDHGTGSQKICVKTTYVDEKPGRTVIGTLYRDDTIDVARYSPSGKYAYGKAGGNVDQQGWIRSSALCSS